MIFIKTPNPEDTTTGKARSKATGWQTFFAIRPRAVEILEGKRAVYAYLCFIERKVIDTSVTGATAHYRIPGSDKHATYYEADLGGGEDELVI